MLRSVLVASLMMILAASAFAADWAETVKVGGDLRYRHEQIDAEGEEMRNRHRIRARLSVDADVEENLSLHFRLASGSDDPVSTNQSLDGAGSTKGFGLDRAFFAWRYDDTGVTVRGGKMKNPFYAPARQEMMWDGDLSPEGLSAHYAVVSGDTKVFLNTAGIWIDEREEADNAAMFGAQAGLQQSLGEAKVTVGGGLFNYTDISGALVDDDFFGNTSTTVGENDVFADDFNLIELFAEIAFAAGDVPVLLFADFVTNSEADAAEQAYQFGLKINKAKDPGSWDLGYNYREVQADALMGAFANSDFGGGGTDVKGHQLTGSYQLSPKAKFGLTYFINEVGLGADKSEPMDYERLQADLKFKF